MTQPEESDQTPTSALSGQIVAGVTASVAGAAMGDQSGIVAAALAPLFARFVQWDQDSLTRAGQVVGEGVRLSRLEPGDIQGWIDADQETRLGFVSHVYAAGMHARDQQVMRALSRVLANGLDDSARIDAQHLYLTALGQMLPAHIAVLGRMVHEINTKDTYDGYHVIEVDGHGSNDPPIGKGREYCVDDLSGVFPHLREGMDFIVSSLASLGCVTDGSPRTFRPLPTYFLATDFGSRCLTYLADTNAEA